MERTHYLGMINRFFEQFPVVALLGARQVGKTTLARDYVSKFEKQKVHFFDLEDPEVQLQLTDSKLTLSQLEGLIVIDEVQLKKELFPLLRVLCDMPNRKFKFLILGSASIELVSEASESLAGRIGYIEVRPFSIAVETNLSMKQLWMRGGFPRAYLANSDEQCFEWLEQFVRTFLERDLARLGFNFPSETMRRLWMMLTHYHGQVLNFSDLGRSLDLSDSTIKRYVDALTGTFMIRTLKPWFENISKRQVRQPKLYLRDTGILHRLMGVKLASDLLTHPRLGASWEGFALEQLIAKYQADTSEVFFWGVHGQMELDLLILKDGKRHGFETKHTSRPTLPKKANEIISTLKLDSLTVVHAGEKTFQLSAKVQAISLAETMMII